MNIEPDDFLPEPQIHPDGSFTVEMWDRETGELLTITGSPEAGRELAEQLVSLLERDPNARCVLTIENGEIRVTGE
jgi:hypothetical protein